jgi:hypothetical protein
MALALGTGLMAAGCSKPESQSQPVAEESTGPAIAAPEPPTQPVEPAPTLVTDVEISGTVAPDRTVTPQSPSANPGATAPTRADTTNGTLSGGSEFVRKSQASPFAQASQALKERYDAALLAYRTGDYSRARGELKILAESRNLTAEQARAVLDLLAQASKIAIPGAAGLTRADTANKTPSGGSEFVRKSQASPFAQAGQALKEGYDAALIAYQIGDYARAGGELLILADSPNLTAEQARAVLDLLAQTVEAAPELVPDPGSGATDRAMPETRP